MKMANLLIIHIDGLSFKHLKAAVESGKMPFVQKILKENYEANPYHIGIPSTTPFAQAGILYGDNFNIPSYRWFDRKLKKVIHFGINSNFSEVANRYFTKVKHPLLAGGAAMGACFSGGAIETFGVLHGSRKIRGLGQKKRDKLHNWIYILDPRHTVLWLWHGVIAILKMTRVQFKALQTNKTFIGKYVLANLIMEILWHKISTFACRQAIRANFPKIYLGLYAFDELGHAFGPTSPFATKTLTEIDRTISKLFNLSQKQKPPYELVLLSDHGQSDTVPYSSLYDTPIIPENLKQKCELVCSGGLGHFYFLGKSKKISENEIEITNKDILHKLSNNPGVGFLVVQNANEPILFFSGKRIKLKELSIKTLKKLIPHHVPLATFKSDLSRLCSFPESGDIILFGAYKNMKQINFENQIGGHGSSETEQSTPFYITRKGLFKKKAKNVSDLFLLLSNNDFNLS